MAKILVVDDERVLVKGITFNLKNEGYQVETGYDGEEAVELARSRADIIITTGGLGPTCDDLTKNVLAEAFGKKLVFDEDSAQRIKSYFTRTNRPMTENNYQQAMLPEGCTVLDNDWGTAPGVAFQAGGTHVLMLLSLIHI